MREENREINSIALIVIQQLRWGEIRQERPSAPDTMFTTTGRRLYVIGDIDGGFRPRSNPYDLYAFGKPQEGDPLANRLQGVWAQPVKALNDYTFVVESSGASWPLLNAERFTQTFADVQLTTCLASLPEAPYLLSVKSLNAVSAAIFLAEVGDPKRYRAAAQCVKLAGIQPAPNASGKKQRSQTPMSHQGRARLRTMLYFTCLRMVQYDNHFAQIYSHLQEAENSWFLLQFLVGDHWLLRDLACRVAQSYNIRYCATSLIDLEAISLRLDGQAETN